MLIKPEHNLPTILVILGASGDLTARKIVPALYHLDAKRKLPDHFAIVGFARRELNDQSFREHLAPALVNHEQTILPSKEFFGKVSYLRGNFTSVADYSLLAAHLKKIDDLWGQCANKIFYLAVPPEHYAVIFKNLSVSGLTDSCADKNAWTRVLIEKPFGSNLASAEKLDELLGEYFKEEQIYRLDHYLAKEMIQNLLTFRFANNLFESNWNRDHIESITIRLHEKIGVEKRGAFYDQIGALSDVGQNHLLQMLALVTMERPSDFSSAAIRESRQDALQVLEPTRFEISKPRSFRAQYDGYREIAGVAPESQTETYFKIRTTLSGKRWQGVRVDLESGKRLAEQRKEIVITFKHPLPCFCPADAPIHYRNSLTIGLEPEEKISACFWAKKPGLAHEIEARTFEFSLRAGGAKAQYIEEYEKLLVDCIAGDQTLFVSSQEVRAMWHFTDRVRVDWQKGLVPLRHYAPDSNKITEIATAALEQNTAVSPEKRGEIGIIGLGKMGANLARRLKARQWRVVGYNRSSEVTRELAKEGLEPAESLAELVLKISRPRTIWLMVSSGVAVDNLLFGSAQTSGLLAQLEVGDTIIDGGNSYFRDTQARAEKIKTLAPGINFLDVGTSGGPAGALKGPCLMIGGERQNFERLEGFFSDLAAPDAYKFFEGHGAGHFVKMVHNGIEYGMMQSLAEGFALMKTMPFGLKLAEIANIYNKGSVIESRLTGWLERGFAVYGEELETVSGSVAATGEGEWTVKTAREQGLSVPVIEDAFIFRVASKEKPSYTGKILSMLRNMFGGHSIK